VKKYKVLEHTADQYIRAFGVTLDEAFANGALALMDTLTDITKVEGNKQIMIEVEEDELEALLYAFIEEVLVTWELSYTLFSEIRVDIVERNWSPKYKLKAWLRGEEFDSEKHPQRVGVKAMTYCLMKIDNTPPNVVIEFVVDI